MDLEELIWPVCEEEYDTDSKIPRLLPNCGHTFCTECLSQLLEQAKKEGKKFWCPEDRAECTPVKSAEEFPKNFALFKIAQK